MEEKFSMEWNMEENFSMEWNMEWKKISGIEYEKIVFHSIPYHALGLGYHCMNTALNCSLKVTKIFCEIRNNLHTKNDQKTFKNDYFEI